jgi:hypothetical protein
VRINQMEQVMETKHTPGPWDYWSGYNPCDRIEAQVTAEGGDIVIASYNHLIAEGEANAKLIAAAPELLECLNNMLDHFEGNIPLWLFEKSESAIAKATE